MKRSFYEMLGVPHDAKQDQIDTAYQLAMAKFDAANSRGAAEATVQTVLIRDGYQTLCDPAKRMTYDAKLAASASGVQLMFFPEGHEARQKLGLEVIILVSFVTLLGGIIYYQLSHKIDAVRIEHGQAVTKQKAAQDKVRVITVDTTQSATVISGAAAKEQKPQ